MDATIVLPAMALVVVDLLLIPVTIYALVATRGTKRVACPDGGELVQVRLGALHTAAAMMAGTRQRVTSCARWPAKAGCDRACERDVHE